MGFEISDHLLRGLHHFMSKTEFDNPPFRKKLLLPEYGALPAYVEAEISEGGLSIEARKQPLIKEIDMFGQNAFTTPVFNKLESDPNFLVVKKIDVDEKIFELIATQNLRAIYVNSDIENNLSGGSMLIISCHDAAFITHISGFCKSTLEPNKKLLEFELADRPLP